MLYKQKSVFGSPELQPEHFLETIMAVGLVLTSLIGPKDGTTINHVSTCCWARGFHIQYLMQPW